MTLPLAATLLLATATPYLLPRHGVSPRVGAALWLSVLALRVVLVVLGALVAVLYLPATAVFQLTTRWCFHAVIPFFTTHLGFSGHRVGDAATLIPGLVLGLSAISAAFAVWRASRRVGTWVRRSSLGPGPKDSLIVGGEEVVVAAAGIRSARVIVSTGALARFDEDELSASLEHERGHIARLHPYLAVAANLLFAVARPLPGSRDALDRLRFCLERDADEYALQRRCDPLALASAICKATADAPAPTPALATLAGIGATARLRLLLDRSAARPRPLIDTAARVMVTALVATVLLALAVTPTLASAGVASLASSAGSHPCQG